MRPVETRPLTIPTWGPIAIVFRRDPLGQVTMNVALRPTVRCHFDEAENILRVILKEQVSTDKETKEDVIVYAIKVGNRLSWISAVA